MSGKNIPIKDVMDLPLQTVLFTMQGISGSHGAHQESRDEMLYVLEAMALTIFKWDESLLVTFKEKLTKHHRDELK